MRAIRWLHISDFHIQNKPSSAQDAVLTAMLDDIEQRYLNGLVFDFVLATGDLAFSGIESEYCLVETFFNKLVDITRLPREMIFCIPGNHDVNRERQKTCFIGAQSILNNQSEIYSFLADSEERETLLIRQSNFRKFQERYFQGQNRVRTDDNLGYVSTIEVDDIRIAIMGLNSAWLANGGQKDNYRLLLGEQQVRNAVKIASHANPHIVIGMAHHPFDLLRDFDRNLSRQYLEESCHYFHCGHLHVPNALCSVSHSGHFLTLAAGASFESRESNNAYTTVSFDPLRSRVDITFVQYNPSRGTFSLEDNQNFPHKFDAPVPCNVGKLADALELHCPSVAGINYYLSAILLGDISEVPIQAGNGFAFGTIDLLQKQPEDEFKAAIVNFLTVGNAIKLLYDRKPLIEILATNGSPVKSLVDKLKAFCKIDNDLKKELALRDANARKLAYTADNKEFQHTLALFDELLAAEEWEPLRIQAERNLEIANPRVTAIAKRMLALCLAQSTEQIDCNRAIDLYKELTSSAEGKAEDWASLATLLADNGIHDQAKETVINAIKAFPQSIYGFVEVGMKIVEATGDLDFREWLSSSKKNRRSA